MECYKLRWVFVLGAIAYLFLIWYHRLDPFFWDTIQFAGKHGLWYYENGLLSGFLPDELNSGHPPSFGIYQAAIWTIFGKCLTTSHFSMLPFLWLNLYYSLRIGEIIVGKSGWLFALALAICPFYLGHSVLVSPDLILVTGFLMTFYGCLKNHRTTIIIGGLILALISIRGQMILGVMVIYYLTLEWKGFAHLRSRLKSTMALFGLSLGIALLFHLVQAFTTDWEGLEASPWAESFGYVPLKGWLRQLGLFAWRILDYGMVAPVFIVLVDIKQLWTNKHRLLILAILITLALVVILTPRVGLMNHRYFLPLQITILAMATHTISKHWNSGLKGKGMALFVLLSMVGGNLIIYPDEIAQGWDSTAAHWPIHKMEREIYDFVIAEDLAITQVGTAFPYRSSRHYSTLDSISSGYQQYDLSSDSYILYSNIMNEFSDHDIERLKTDYQPIRALNKSGLHLTLYKRVLE